MVELEARPRRLHSLESCDCFSWVIRQSPWRRAVPSTPRGGALPTAPRAYGRVPPRLLRRHGFQTWVNYVLGCSTVNRALVTPPIALAIDVVAPSLAEIG